MSKRSAKALAAVGPIESGDYSVRIEADAAYPVGVYERGEYLFGCHSLEEFLELVTDLAAIARKLRKGIDSWTK